MKTLNHFRGSQIHLEQPSRGVLRLPWIEQIKALALLWIFWNHTIERLFQAPLIGNPSAAWPEMAARVSQLLTPLRGYGWADIPVNVGRYLGWFGDQGVSLFLIVSGFGLTWGLLSRPNNTLLNLAQFYLRRAERIYPLWWAVHALFLLSAVLLGFGLSPSRASFWLSFIGLRVTPRTLYYFCPAWWYVSLLIQLYLVYPLLWRGLKARGPAWLLTTVCAISLPLRGVGLLIFHSYLDAWSRGAIFITRLPEFAFGVCLAAWLFAEPQRVADRLRTGSTALLAAVSYAAGTLLSLSLTGMTVAPLVLGVSAFVLLYAALHVVSAEGSWVGGGLSWLGQHSYSVYLLHQPLIDLLLPSRPEHLSLGKVLGKIALTFTLSLVAALGTERVTAGVQEGLTRWHKRLGLIRSVIRVGVLLLLVVAVPIAAELMVRRFAPQEVYGWGERPALQPDPTLTYRLKPSRQTRLRWAGYDYQVISNSLGFPGPEYPIAKQPGSFRILTTGDAFTSAEGVDTGKSWPRLLENRLAELLPGRKVEILNFAITGYGPNQYLAIIKHFAPIYRPDLVIVGFFVNDYEDVLRTDETFRESIGFNRPSPDSLRSIAKLPHLKRFIQLKLAQPLQERLLHRPTPNGLFLGNFLALEPGAPQYQRGPALAGMRLADIKAVAESLDSQVIVAMIPAPVQVCAPSELSYYPRYVALGDKTKFDLDLPQRLTQDLAHSTGVQYLDLRPILRSVPGCPYQPYNMHWKEAGHAAVAGFLAQHVSSLGRSHSP